MTFSKWPLFSNVIGLQFRISGLTKRQTKKYFFCECSKFFRNLTGEILHWIHFIKVTGLLSIIYILQKSHPKSLYIFFTGYSQNYTENGIYCKGFLWVMLELLKLLESTCNSLHFNKVTEESSQFDKNSIMQVAMIQKVALPEIPRNYLLTTIAGFLKMFWKFSKMSREGSVTETLYSKMQALPFMFSKFWKISEITRAVRFLFTEAGASKFPIE